MSFDRVGLRIANVPDVAALLAGQPDQYSTTPNIVQIPADAYDTDACADRSVVVRPTWIHWVSAAEGGSAASLSRQTYRQRSQGRAALAAISELLPEISEPIDAALYDEWLPLYVAQINRLRHGRNLAAFHRGTVIAPDSGHGMVVWRRDGRIACGIVYRIDQGLDAFIARYIGVDAAERDNGLPRAMYLTIADMAADRGLRWVTLGSDVNFYGALVSPGLCAFKLRLGFAPVPADLMGRKDCHHVAERLVDLSGLEPPVLRFEHSTPKRQIETVEEFLETSALSLVSVAPPDFRSQLLDGLPEHRRLVL